MPQNELLDLILAAFKRYTHWPMRSLRAELNQPEAYLRQNLEKMAHLVRTGDFSGTWELKPEFKESNYAFEDIKDEIAPTMSYGLDGASDNDPTGSGVESDDDEDNAIFESVA